MDSELYRAAISGDINALKEKEETIIGVRDQLTPTNNSVLHLASQSGKAECVQEILKLHPSLLCKPNSRGETALHLAAGEGHSEVVRALVEEAKRSLPLLPHEGDIDLEIGVGSSSGNEVRNFIRMANAEGDTALHEAMRFNHADVVRVLGREDQNYSHAPNHHEETPLYLAAYRGHIDSVMALCETCNSLNYSGPDGRTALHAAVISHSYDSVKYLLLADGVDLIKVTDNHGWTVFHYAAYYGIHQVIQDFIVANKSVAYITDKTANRTALHIAARRGNLDVMAQLIKFCPDCCDMVDKRGRNILHVAVEHDRMVIIEFILQNCPIIKSLLIQKDDGGNTPLHLLATFGCYVPELLEHKLADREAVNNKNHTPLDMQYCDVIRFRKQKYIGKTLRRSGAIRTYKLRSVIRDDEDMAEKYAKKKEKEPKNLERIRKISDTHMIVAALIATVTFTAGFTLPGGYDGNEGANRGMAILTRKAAFKAFIVADAIGLTLSTASLIIYFIAAVYDDEESILNFVFASVILNVVSIVAMMLAFITGTYAVLAHSSGLAICLCAIGCSFFPILYYTIRKFMRDR